MAETSSFLMPLPDSQTKADSQQWINLVPAGQFLGRDGRGPYCLASPAKVIDRSRSITNIR
jgi:phage I-like protein